MVQEGGSIIKVYMYVVDSYTHTNKSLTMKAIRIVLHKHNQFFRLPK